MNPKDQIWYHVVVMNKGKNNFIGYRMNEETAIEVADDMARSLKCETMVVKTVAAIRPQESYTLKLMEEKSHKADEYLSQFIKDFDDDLPF